MQIKNLLIIEQKLNPTGGGVQRVSYLLGEEFKIRGYNVWYAFHIKETDTQDIDSACKFCYDISLTKEEIYTNFSNFIQANSIDTLFIQNVYSLKMSSVYESLKIKYNLKIICCLHANPDKNINKNIWKLTLPSIYIKDKIKELYHKFVRDIDLLEKRKAYSICDRYVVLSERFIPVFEKVIKISDSSKLRGINNPATFTNNTKSDVKTKEKILLVVGRMYENQKRLSNVLMVWGKISKEFADWKLYLVGDGPHLNLYKTLVDKWELPKVHFIGHCDDVQEYFERASIFMMTSIWEGFCMTLIEAQSKGCVPVVFDNFEAVHDIIDGSNGVVVKSNDLDSFSDAVKTLMRDRKSLKKMSINAKISSEKNFNRERIVKKWLELFNELENENL